MQTRRRFLLTAGAAAAAFAADGDSGAHRPRNRATRSK